ncbi:hypothetical protein [Maribellus sediminis]|uniref:hypothetical protein n=1 Tax=Maribellus sediminis TaxID=2696285 RepID=UPI00142FFDDA|nr:hypothetical protein [Maribellus sediminis]
MLKLILVFILSATHISIVQAQKLKKHTEQFGNYKEVWHVDKTSKFRCGESYLLNVKTKDTLAIGNYFNASRTGVWKFNQDKTGVEYMVYDYTNDSLIFLNQLLVADSFLVKTALGYEVQKVDRPLIYVGAENEIKRTIAQDIDIPVEFMKEGKLGLSVLQYFVDEQGNLTGPKLVSGFCREIENSVNQKIAMLPGKFLPAVVNGHTTASSFFIRINVGLLSSELLSGDGVPPYIQHVDVQYGTGTTTVKRVSVRTEIRTVDFSEIR